MKRLVLLSLILSCAVSMHAQIQNDDVHELPHMNQSYVRSEFSVPGFDGYQTLKCDFHIHTVFSDGLVWPTVRVMEAWQEGLDAIAITDHIEYRPRKEVVKGDLNEAFRVAKKKGDQMGFIVIQGTEITRSKPLGHLNALFIHDANAMNIKDSLKAIDIALEQGAFIQWNHPGWPDDKSTIYPEHEKLLAAGKIHGVEVFNEFEYYPVVFDWFRRFDIAPMANTDVHEGIFSDYGRETGKMRPLTLVFATEKTENAIKEALMARRTAALFDGTLVGKEEHLMKLIHASLHIRIINGKTAEVTNISDIPYEMTNNGKIYSFPARKTVQFPVPSSGSLVFKNCFVGFKENLSIPYEYWRSLID